MSTIPDCRSDWSTASARPQLIPDRRPAIGEIVPHAAAGAPHSSTARVEVIAGVQQDAKAVTATRSRSRPRRTGFRPEQIRPTATHDDDFRGLGRWPHRATRELFLIEPSEVERSVRTKGASKRRPNLTYEELEALADEAGVRNLYDHAVAAFESLLQKRTTKSSIGFAGAFDGSRKNVISLLPGKSNAQDGLFYRLYKNRFAELSALPLADIERLVPQPHKDWSFDPSGQDPDWSGFEGFIASREEADRLAGALRQGR